MGNVGQNYSPANNTGSNAGVVTTKIINYSSNVVVVWTEPTLYSYRKYNVKAGHTMTFTIDPASVSIMMDGCYYNMAEIQWFRLNKRILKTNNENGIMVATITDKQKLVMHIANQSSQNITVMLKSSDIKQNVVFAKTFMKYSSIIDIVTATGTSVLHDEVKFLCDDKYIVDGMKFVILRVDPWNIRMEIIDISGG
jgi:hypothetical protein